MMLYDDICFKLPIHYPMTWLSTTGILYNGILQCRSPQCRDLPSVAMSILLLLVMVKHQQWYHVNNYVVRSYRDVIVVTNIATRRTSIMTIPATNNGHHDITETYL